MNWRRGIIALMGISMIGVGCWFFDPRIAAIVVGVLLVIDAQRAPKADET